MATYHQSGHAHTAVIAGQSVSVDSYTEARFLQYLEEHGFHDHWIKPVVGGQKGRHRYTPDVELSIQEHGMTHRAIVEVKPSLKFFTPYINRRMRGVASYYLTDVLYLFTDNNQLWHRIDPRTGTTTPSEIPEPGLIPINKLHKTLSVTAPAVFSHHYRQGFMPVFIRFLVNASAEFLQAPFKVPRKRKRKR